MLLGVAINLDPVLALLVCKKFVRSRAHEARDISASLSTRLDEVFHGIAQIKLNSAEDYQAKQYRDVTRRFVRIQVRTVTGSAVIPAMVDIMSGFGFMVVSLCGGSEIISGDKTINGFMSFFTAMGIAFDPMRRFASIGWQWQIAAASIERLKELMESHVKLKSPETPPKPAQPKI